MHEVLVNRLGGLSLPRKSVVRLTDRPDMTLDVYRGRKTTMQQQQPKLRLGAQLLWVNTPFRKKMDSSETLFMHLQCLNKAAVAKSGIIGLKCII